MIAFHFTLCVLVTEVVLGAVFEPVNEDWTLVRAWVHTCVNTIYLLTMARLNACTLVTRRTFIFICFYFVFVHATVSLQILVMHEADKHEVCHEQLPKMKHETICEAKISKHIEWASK